MILIKRENTTKTIEVTANHNKNEYLPYCQASFNSDGNITLRNYDKSNRHKDEIIILSNSETEALFKLFSQIGQKNKNYGLPF